MSLLVSYFSIPLHDIFNIQYISPKYVVQFSVLSEWCEDQESCSKDGEIYWTYIIMKSNLFSECFYAFCGIRNFKIIQEDTRGMN
jgi:hypothetical protein